MPIFSYLAYPFEGAGESMIESLQRLPHCEVIPSENRNVLILVTDTPNQEAETALKHRLNGIRSLKSLHMTFGHVDETTPDN